VRSRPVAASQKKSPPETQASGAPGHPAEAAKAAAREITAAGTSAHDARASFGLRNGAAGKDSRDRPAASDL